MLFDAVVANDHETLIKLFASNARNSLVSYLSMKTRWAQQQEFYGKAGKDKLSLSTGLLRDCCLSIREKIVVGFLEFLFHPR